MSMERARAHMERYNLQDKIRVFDVSSATVELAAQAVGCAPARIAKTLSFLVDGSAVLIVTAGDAKIDNARFKAFFHTKATMLPADRVTELIGHAVGGVCPFGVNEGVKVYLDASMRRFETVFPACGSGNSAIELTMAELERASNYVAWVDVCKNWHPEEALAANA